MSTCTSGMTPGVWRDTGTWKKSEKACGIIQQLERVGNASHLQRDSTIIPVLLRCQSDVVSPVLFLLKVDAGANDVAVLRGAPQAARQTGVQVSTLVLKLQTCGAGLLYRCAVCIVSVCMYPSVMRMREWRPQRARSVLPAPGAAAPQWDPATLPVCECAGGR